jgi:hypothetical protein
MIEDQIVAKLTTHDLLILIHRISEIDLFYILHRPFRNILFEFRMCLL